jgi:hypothetical protein
MCFAVGLGDRPICVGCERGPTTLGVPPPPDWHERIAAFRKKNPHDGPLSLKQQFIAELNPKLLAIEQAALVENTRLASQLAIEVLELCRDYEHAGLSRADIRDASNNPVAAAIEERLGLRKRKH